MLPNATYLNSWERMAPVAKSDLSAFIWNRIEIFKKIRTSAKVMAVFGKLKVSC